MLAYDDLDDAVTVADDTSFGLLRLDLEQRRGVGGRRGPPAGSGTVFVNTHGLSAIDMDAPIGGWKQSGFGVELGPEGMQAFARQRVVIQGRCDHPHPRWHGGRRHRRADRDGPTC